MERQEFLKKAGIGSVLASFPLLADVAWAGDDDDDGGNRRGKLRYYFVAFSGVEPSRALTATPDAIVMSGCGSFNSSRVSGGGEYVRTNGTLIPNAPVNDTGSWKAQRLLGFQPDPQGRTFGVVIPGVVRMEVKMISAVDGRIRRPTLEVVCNVGPAGIITGFGAEGFRLSGGGVPTFVQLTPTVGLTFITAPVRRRKDDDEDDDD
jgi:hypothetical protein